MQFSLFGIGLSSWFSKRGRYTVFITLFCKIAVDVIVMAKASMHNIMDLYLLFKLVAPAQFLVLVCNSWMWVTVITALTHTHTHTHPFNGPFSGTTRVNWYQKGKTNVDFTEARDSEWQWLYASLHLAPDR